MATRDGPDLLARSRILSPDKARWESEVRLGATDRWQIPILRVDENDADTTQPTTNIIFASGVFRVPDDYVQNAVILIVWFSTKTTGDVRFKFLARAVAGDDAESFDQSGAGEISAGVTDTAGGAAFRRMEASIALTSGDYVAGDEVQFELSCDGTDGADTLAGARAIVRALFRYDNL